MSAVFVSTALKTLYEGNSNAVSFRTNGTDKEDNEIKSLDLRIAAFEKVIVETAAKPGDFPYNAEGLKREFMDEVLALLLTHRTGNIYYKNYSITFRRDAAPNDTTQVIFNPFNNNDATNGTLKDAVTTVTALSGFTPQGGYTVGQQLLPNPKNFADLTDAQKRELLDDQGQSIWDHYSSLITEVFKEGAKLANNPNDPSSGAAVKANVVTSIPEVTYGTNTYDRVTKINGQMYLVKKGATTYEITKVVINNGAGDPADFVLGFDPGTAPSQDYLAVNDSLQPISGNVVVTMTNQRNLSPAWYLYYWNEARIKILRSKLAYKEAVTSEIRDDLAKAQAVYADLENLAGQTRAQSEDGKTMNPNLSDESMLMDMWEARVSSAGEQMLDTGGADDKHNYTNWATNRSKVKNYIDLKSTQSQDAMLDYQTTLNRFNNAYEVMSKLQEKLDGLVKTQLRNVG